MSEQETYTLAQIRSGSGWPKGARFALVQPEATTAVYARVAAEPSPPEAVEAQRAAVMAVAEAAGLVAEDFTEYEQKGPTDVEDVRLIAAIESGDVSVLITDTETPEGAAGQILLAGRACRRLREAAADAVALACEGRLAEALDTAGEVSDHLGTMRTRLRTARNLKDQR